ncbi:MAG: hypothetical protein KBC98_00830 [Candidatus Pacebacteria bacterium]|jgi:hypothetical protein|nr:hypothetical protein [Candidatus Paceibacterota bacterium]
MKESSFFPGYAEDLNKRTEEVKEKIEAGGKGAIDASFELDKLRNEAYDNEELRKEAEIEKDFEIKLNKLLIEGKVKKYTIETGGKTGEEYKKELADKNIYVNDWKGWTNELLSKISPSKSRESSDFLLLTVKDLGFEDDVTTEQFYDRAQGLGLELCEPEDGPEFRLVSEDKGRDLILIGMNQISVSSDSNNTRVFCIGSRSDGQLMLDSYDAPPSDKLDLNSKWVFRLKKKKVE